MTAEHAFPPDLAPLAIQFADRLGEALTASSAIDIVLREAADERLALAYLVKLAEQAQPRLAAILRQPEAARDLIFSLGASEFVAAGLSAKADGLELFESSISRDLDSLIEDMRCPIDEVANRADAELRLREFKRRNFLRIAIADLTGHFDVTATMVAMSRLADECVRAALSAAGQLLGATDLADSFCVVAMGKLGAGELNLCSDIDLMYLFDSPDPEGSRESVSRLAELTTELLSNCCFRTDLRLRPGGRDSPLVVSLDGAVNFYSSFGQTWERAALLRARPIAGHLELGRNLLAELNRFIYRRYLDFDTLRQLRVMKRRIEEELRPAAMIERNIKLGYGGIRELEFIVQALILIYGGRDARLRTERTITALDRLESFGYLSKDRARELASAYLFLRDVEHKLQVVAGRQTHSLPTQREAFAALAARMGSGKDPEAAKRFQLELERCRDLVATQFREMLSGSDAESVPIASEAARAAWRNALEPVGSAPILHLMGFAHPTENAADLGLLIRGPVHAPASPRRRELLDQLGPILIDEISRLPDPGLALRNLADFIASVGARTSFLSLLEQHPATRRVMLRLFASSSYLSTLFIRHPEMLDTLVRSDLARLTRVPAELAGEVAGLVAASPDFESRLDALRSFRHQEFLRIAIADLAGNLELEAVQIELTALAGAVLREALAMATAAVSAQRIIPPDLRLCVMALGRLGAREMSYNSDLDLIVIYDDPSEVSASSRDVAARITQRLIAILESRTREGYAYKIDLRLRPSGNAGPLVASLTGFREYHRAQAAVWERQAMVRARVVAGDRTLGREVEAARRKIVFGRPLNTAEVGEIVSMRMRMERELGNEKGGHLNLKQGPGGLVDVEFLTQMIAMRHGADIGDLTARSTIALIRALAEHGLLPSDDAVNLAADYRFLAHLENRLRIETDSPAWALTTDVTELTPLARRMGFSGDDGARTMLDELTVRRARIRTIFTRCFAVEQCASDGRFGADRSSP